MASLPPIPFEIIPEVMQLQAALLGITIVYSRWNEEVVFMLPRPDETYDRTAFRCAASPAHIDLAFSKAVNSLVPRN